MEQEHHSTLAIFEPVSSIAASSAETADRNHQSYAYDVFISYRRRDATWLARWIRNKLLQFRLPPEIVHELPRHKQELHDRRPQIWLDTSYEKSSDDFLLKKVFPALDTSARLIVVNTPAALENITANDGTLQDNWLVREIEHFLGEARAGESERPVDVVFGPGSMEGHYPGRLSEKPRWDWIDLRSFSIWRARTFSDTLDDGFAKLVAALYDVPDRFIPILRREERRRRHRVITGFAIAGLSVAAITAAIAIYALIQLRNTYLAQATALRGTLEPVRRSNSLELLAKAAKIRVGNDLRDEAAAAMALVQLQNPRVWNGYPLGSKGIGFNSNLERYARGDAQGNISIRRIEDDEELMLMHVPGFGSDPWVLRFSPDDRYLAAKYDSDQLKDQLYVWDLSRPGVDAKYLGKTCGSAFDFDPNSQVLAVGRCDGSGSIDIFDLASASSMPTKRLKQALACWEDCLQFVAFRPDGQQLAVSGLNQPAVQVLELNQDKAVLSVSIPTGVIGIAWNADGGLLAAAAADHRIYVWDVANLRQDSNPPQPLQVLTGHEAEVRQVAFSAANNLLASTANDETVRIWEPIRGKELIRIAGASPMQFSADGRRLAFAAGTQQLVRWELAAPSEYSVVQSREAPTLKGPWSADFSPNGRLLASAHSDGLRIWDLSNNKEIALIDQTEDSDRLGYIRSVLFQPDGTKLITCGPGDERVPGKGGLYIWSIESQPGGIANALQVRKSRKIDLPKGAVCEWATLSDKGRTLVVADSFNGQVMLRDLDHSTEWTLLPAVPDVKFVATHPDARYIAYGRWKFGVGVLDLRTKNPIELESGPASFFAVFSPNGKWLVTGSADHYHIWEVGSWAKPIHELPGYHGIAGLVGALTFSPDGAILAIARSRSMVELVNANKSWEEIVTLKSPDDSAIMNWLKFSADGSQLAVVTQAHLIYIWDLRAIRGQLSGMNLDWELPPYRLPKQGSHQPH